MNPIEKIPVYHRESKSLLGFAVRDSTGWQAQTVFGYAISRTNNQAEAEYDARELSKEFTAGMWRYYDKIDYDWYPCRIEEANETGVTVGRTNELGFKEPDTYKLVAIANPDETTLIKG